MHDIATTVVSHLEMARKTLVYARGLRMVRGLSRFVEGKVSIDEDDLPYESPDQMHHRQTQQSASLGASHRTHALNAAGNKERWDDAHDEKHDQHKSRSSNVNGFTTKSQGQTSSVMLDPFPHTEQEQRSTHAQDASAHQPSSKQPKHQAGSDIQEDLLSDGVRKSIGRAAVIINQALATSGVLFLDASVGEFGHLRNAENGGSSAEDSDDNSTSTGSDKEKDDASIHAQEEQFEGLNIGSQKLCRQLGSAYDQSSLLESNTGVLHRGIPEKFLKSIMRRNPYGRIWHL